MGVLDRVKAAWNAFLPSNQTSIEIGAGSGSYGYRPQRTALRYSNEKTIITAIYNRLSIDIASVVFRHTQQDSTGRYMKDFDSELNKTLTLDPNLDQGPRAFRQDIALTLIDEGCIAIVPIDTTVDPQTNEIFDVFNLRVGKIVAWYPAHVRVNVYNEATGNRQDILLEKRSVGIVENPFYTVMNQPNSTLQRLIRKLSLLDAVDEASSSGKLDLIIQLPYAVKSEARKLQAEQRRESIEFQLKGNQYGIAYTDATEKITQLNRPAENNLLTQITYLTDMLYGQLGLTEAILNGTADENAMINYFSRTVEPFTDAIVEAMQKAFLGPAGTGQNQRIQYFTNPFKFIPVDKIAEIADKFTRNEILTGNEIRMFMGIPPSSDPKADQLQNSNMPPPTKVQLIPGDQPQNPVVPQQESVANSNAPKGSQNGTG